MLAKKDLEQIKGVVKEVVKEEIDVAFEDFAVIVNKGFEQTVSKVELNEFKDEFKGLGDEFKGFKVETQEGFRAINSRLDYQDAELSSHSADLREIKENKIKRFEFDDLEGRVKYTELKLGIESGK